MVWEPHEIERAALALAAFAWLARALLAAGGAAQLVAWVCGSEELVPLVPASAGAAAAGAKAVGVGVGTAAGEGAEEGAVGIRRRRGPGMRAQLRVSAATGAAAASGKKHD